MAYKNIDVVLAILMDCLGITYVRLVPCDKEYMQYMYIKSTNGNYVQTWIIKKFSKNETKRQLRINPSIPEAISPGEYQKIKDIHKRE